MTKADLKRYRGLRIKIEQLKERMAEIRNEMESPPIPHLTGMPAGTRKGDRTERLVIEYGEIYDKYCDTVEEAIAMEMEILDAIEILPEMEQAVIRYYYITGLKWEEVCVRINYAWRQVHRIHARALDHLRSA